MSEHDFQRAVCDRLTLSGRRVLRVSDGTDARRGVYGLRAITSPRIDSTGADLLVLTAHGLPCVVARSMDDVVAAFVENPVTPFFLELKEPSAKRRTQLEQDEWMAWVRGERR